MRARKKEEGRWETGAGVKMRVLKWLRAIHSFVLLAHPSSQTETAMTLSSEQRFHTSPQGGHFVV
jgi:hypothetical protein